MFVGCMTQSLHHQAFLMWETKGNKHGFDKSASITATFLATASEEAQITVIHNGKYYNPTFIEMVNSFSPIARYSVRIPGPFPPGNELLQVKAKYGEFTCMDELQVEIFPSRLLVLKTEDGEELSLEDEISALIKSLGKGDAVEFNALPSSGLNIPLNQFRTYIHGTTNNKPLIGTSVMSADQYTIPSNANKVTIRMVWIDPLDQTNIVTIFPSDGTDSLETTPTLKSPRIISAEAKRVYILEKPRFEVITDIKAPSYSDMALDISDVSIEIVDQNIHGYRVVPIGNVTYQEGLSSITFELQGNTSNPTRIQGMVKVRVKATCTSPTGEKSAFAIRTFKLPVNY